jgi:hypothetical protein
MQTGSTLALLPPENATGNFIKVVQRLPVRIDLEGYNPKENTLFIGTSVVPYVYLNKPPTGPDGLPRQPLVHLRARLVLTNDGRRSFARKSFRSGEPVARVMPHKPP